MTIVRMMGVVAAASLVCVSCATMRTAPAAKAQRFGSVIGVKADEIERYKTLHAAVWPSVSRMLRESNIRNYSIYLRRMPDGNHYLFSYFEYTGNDLKGDMARLTADPEIKRWWKETDPLQIPLPDRKDGEWWASMEEVFHQD